MSLFFSTGIITKQLVEAISWTLIHSVWQGILLSLLAAAVVLFTKRNSPALRYNLLAGCLLVFVITVAATLFLEIRADTAISGSAQTNNASGVTQIISVMPGPSNGISISISRNAINFVNAYSGWMVLTWMVITLLRCLQLSFGLYGLYRLKKVQTYTAGTHWNSRINALRAQMQIKKPVRLLQSGLAKVPSAIGYFSPVILFPCGMLTSMTAGEVEAILVHELAHIRRHDFVVNMMQNVVEIIFFFNPAVLWVSSLVKAERENCCDDIAIEYSCNKRLYINALVTFGELHHYRPPVLVTALGGNKNQLMHRIKRIIYNDNKTLNNMEKKFLAAGIILSCVFACAFSTNIAQQKQPEDAMVVPGNGSTVVQEKTIDSAPATDTVPISNNGKKDMHHEIIQTEQDGKDYEIITRNGEVDQLYINGEKVPDDKKDNYKEVTDDLIRKMKIDGAKAREELKRSQKEMAEAMENQKGIQKDMQEKAYEMEKKRNEMKEVLEQHQKDMEHGEKDMERAQKEAAVNNDLVRLKMELAEKEMAGQSEKSKKDAKLSEKDVAMQNEKYKKAMDALQREKGLYMEKYQKEMEKSQQDMALYQEKALKEARESQENMALNREKMAKEMEGSKLSMARAQKDMEQAQATQKGIISDLIDEHIIKNESDLSSYVLSNDELIVNGTRQPGTIHKKFKDKYVRGMHSMFMYHK
ncbi:MAG: M56 family metallopeptidase [Ginsengibacter sp.]